MFRLGTELRAAGAVGQRVVGGPGGEVVVEGLGVDDAVVDQPVVRQLGFIDRVVDAAGLDEQFVAEDALFRGVPVPALPVNQPQTPVAVEGPLQFCRAGRGVSHV